MEFSLVIPTLARTHELARLLQSLADQTLGPSLTLQDIELLVIDQNEDDRLSGVLGSFPSLSLSRIRVPSRGLSRAKNEGLQRAQGRWILFPDDDCHFSPDTLTRLRTRLQGTAEKALFFRAVTPETGTALVAAPRTFRKLDPRPSAQAFWSPQIAQVYPLAALRRHHIRFDERLGIGAPEGFGSGEDTDLALQALAAGIPIEYDPTIEVFHPAVDPMTMSAEKTELYARGFGAVCRKHGLGAHLAWKVAKQLGGAALSLARRDTRLARQRATTAWGRLRGFSAFGRA